MKAFLAHIFTDAAGRPEVKMILGVPLFIVAVGFVLSTRDLAIFGVLMGTSLTLMGITAAADSAIDTAMKGG
jgi:uncharacterized membrane protein YdjX (TVP38/TMEM64 family)